MQVSLSICNFKKIIRIGVFLLVFSIIFSYLQNILIRKDGNYYRQKQIYNIVLEGQRKVIEAIKPELPFKRLNEILIEHYEEELKKIGLIKDKSEISKYYYHGVSHYLGLDTHDVSRDLGTDNGLKPGMVITVEPGLYIAEEGIGIRIEDDILVTETGYENLSKDIIKTVEDIEDFFKNR